MKLYFSPGSCSLAPHIVLNELGMKFDLERVDLRAKTFSGGDFRQVNPKGSVPVLQTDSGDVLTEGPIITQYLADQAGPSSLAAKMGTMERYRQMEMLNYLTSEVHKSFSPLFRVESLVPAEVGPTLRENLIAVLGKRFDLLNQILGRQAFLMGAEFTLADAYLFTMLRWTKLLKIDMQPWPALLGFCERVEARPAVQKAMQSEGLRH